MTLPQFMRRLEAAGIGLFTGIAVAWLVGDANYVALAAGGLLALFALLLTRALTPAPARHDVYLLVALALTLRYAVAVTIYDGSLAAGRGGFVTGDDANYADLSWHLAQLLRGQAVSFDFESQAYLLGTFVYLETAIFALVGPNVVLVELLNAAFGAGLVALICALCCRVYEHEGVSLLAGAVVSFYPSLILWTSLNLKDSLTLFLIASVLWLIVVFQHRPALWLVLAMYAAMFFMESLRFYIFIGLALVIPVGVIVAPVRSRRLFVSSLAAVALSGYFLVAQATGNQLLSLSTFTRLETERIAMALGARTAFGGAVVRVKEGTTYYVPLSSANPTPPGHTPQVVVVPLNTRIAIGTSAPGQNSVSVLPGDIIVVGSPGLTPAPASEQGPLVVPAGATEIEIVDAGESAVALRTIQYLPIGLAFALLAPFPWAIQRPFDLLPLPEMLVWYALLVLTVVSLVRYRYAWRSVAPIILFVSGTLVIFALAEGNTGTLYRHRAMVVPFAMLLAAPSVRSVWDESWRRIRNRGPVHHRRSISFRARERPPTARG